MRFSFRESFCLHLVAFLILFLKGQKLNSLNKEARKKANKNFILTMGI